MFRTLDCIMSSLNGHTLAMAVVAIIVVWVMGKLAAFFQDRWRYQKLVSAYFALPCSCYNEQRTI
jgi:hypothetical protein